MASGRNGPMARAAPTVECAENGCKPGIVFRHRSVRAGNERLQFLDFHVVIRPPRVIKFNLKGVKLILGYPKTLNFL